MATTTAAAGGTKKKIPKDPDAPKRPMSAFLDYSKTFRSQVIRDNPEVKDNKDISKILGALWRNASDAERKPFVDKELKARLEYKERSNIYRKQRDAARKLNPPPPPVVLSDQRFTQDYYGYGGTNSTSTNNNTGLFDTLEPLSVPTMYNGNVTGNNSNIFSPLMNSTNAFPSLEYDDGQAVTMRYPPLDSNHHHHHHHSNIFSTNDNTTNHSQYSYHHHDPYATYRTEG
eukprot:CAMPEP_0172419804 /NCGR_PEP_ID=MMETSP1064-20121228/6210_1 /TAXON_ID=202472 /ORGANISM="Aulacoseira subarctica , Strain CCAP 1002/5" /LENGTH=229 /DNA_ID=CAMNT_0013159459 /DNA_START=115 /DNA_END=804 /DNA_ORIENTATION=-